MAILVALKDCNMTGYGINNHFMKSIGDEAYPSTVYSCLASLERQGLIKCVKNSGGRVYSITAEGNEVVEAMGNIVKETKGLLDKLLVPSKKKPVSIQG